MSDINLRFIQSASVLLQAVDPFFNTRRPLQRSSSSEQLEAQALTVATTALESVKRQNLKTLPPQTREAYRSLTDLIYSFFEKFKKKVPAKDAEKFEAMALSGKLGGRVTAEVLLDPAHRTYQKLIKANHLHHKIQALSQQPQATADGATLLVAGYGEVPWKKIQRRVVSDMSGNKVVNIFSYQGKEIFRTDARLRFVDGYSYNHQGVFRESGYVDTFVPFDRRNPREWGERHILEVWTSIDYKESPIYPRGDHAYLVLKDNWGNLFGAGRCIRSLQTPDPYLLFPKDHRTYRKTEIPLDKATFDFFIRQIKEDKTNLNGKMNKYNQYVYGPALMLGKNCTNYVKDLLLKRGIQIETEISPPLILFKKLCPMKWREPIMQGMQRFTSALPSPVAKGLHFFPPWYLFIVLFGIVRFVLNLFLPKELAYVRKMDLFDCIFRPWNVKMDHPLGLADWQDKHATIATQKMRQLAAWQSPAHPEPITI